MSLDATLTKADNDNMHRVAFLLQIDRLFQWQSNPHSDIRNTINKQKPNTRMEFDERTQLVIVQLAEQVQMHFCTSCVVVLPI